jgi:hypothetical protein
MLVIALAARSASGQESATAGGAPQADPAQHDGAANDGTAPTEDEIAARALERALVQRGALLLAPRQVEIVPELDYLNDAFDTSATSECGGAAFARVRSDLATASLAGRVGLPARFQVEAVVPFVAARQRVTAGSAEQRATAEPGIGDLRLSLTRNVLSTRGGAFQALAGASWRAPTGRSPYGIPATELGRGNGVHSFGANATIVRISDPLVLLATGTYTWNLARDTREGRVDVGDTLKLGLASLLAITPHESLSLQFEIERGGDTRLDGAPMLGTDHTSAVMQVAVSTVLSRRALLTVAVTMGVTADAPDLQMSVAVPIRF